MINAGFRDDSNITWLMCATWLHIFKNFVKFVEELMLSNRLIFDRWNTSDSDWKCQRAKTGRIQIESDRIEYRLCRTESKNFYSFPLLEGVTSLLWKQNDVRFSDKIYFNYHSNRVSCGIFRLERMISETFCVCCGLIEINNLHCRAGQLSKKCEL